jgi:hypothetical protein
MRTQYMKWMFSLALLAVAFSSASAAAEQERAILFERIDGKLSQYQGSVSWRTGVSTRAGQRDDLEIRADIEVPERRMAVIWLLRRNLNRMLPASHTIEIVFTPDTHVLMVPDVRMGRRPSDPNHERLAGLAFKAAPGHFLIGLPAGNEYTAENTELLRGHEWIDIPISYDGRGAAILSFSKGTTGDRVFTEAFAAWSPERLPQADLPGAR